MIRGLLGLVAIAAFMAGAPITWTMIKPVRAHRTGYTADPALSEASGAAVSRANPGLIWTINDSDNPPDLLAIDTLGRLRASFRLLNTTNVDWEEVALGPCGTETCVYVSDTGDNDERRDSVVLYRVKEPIARAARPTGVVREDVTGVEALHFRYPDGPHDVEAMVVTPTGDALLVTKGRSHGVLVFRLAAALWQQHEPHALATAERIDSLPIAASLGVGRVVTGMALAPDGKHVMVRTYRDLYPFALRADDTFRPMGRPTGCDILGLEPQGEGVAYLDAQRMVLTSERGLFRAGTVWIVECPVTD